MKITSTAASLSKIISQGPMKLRRNKVIKLTRIVYVLAISAPFLVGYDANFKCFLAFNIEITCLEGFFSCLVCINRIFQLRGAEPTAQCLGHNQRVTVRCLAIRIAITQHRPDLLLASSWHNVLPTTLEDELFGIICRVPSLLQRQDLVSRCAKVYGAYDNLDLIIRGLIDDSIQEARAFQDWEHKARTICCELSG